jgi:hypothetical protein
MPTPWDNGRCNDCGEGIDAFGMCGCPDSKVEANDNPN